MSTLPGSKGTEAERAALFEKHKNRIDSEGELVVKAEDGRSQLENRKLAVERSLALIVKAQYRDKLRRRRFFLQTRFFAQSVFRG